MSGSKSKRGARPKDRARLERRSESPTVSPPAGAEVLLEPEVMVRCRIGSRAQIWKLEQAEKFPRRKRYGFRRIGWYARDIEEWLVIGADGWLAKYGSAAAA